MNVWACQNDSKSGTQSSASAAASAAAPNLSGIRQRLLSAEHRRDSNAVRDEDLEHSDAKVRVWAVRALARIGDQRAREALSARLRDEDRAAVVWAAYGLGFACAGHASKFVPRLTLRAASLLAHSEAPREPEALAPISAIAAALARCAGREAENTLRAWLDQALLEETATLALGKLSHYQRSLDDASMVALLDASQPASGTSASALYAFTQLNALSSTVQERLLGVAEKALEQKGQARSYAIRALGSAGPRARSVLESVLLDSKAKAIDRIVAVHALGRIGSEGQLALQEALAGLVPIAHDNILSAEFGILSATLENITPPITKSKQPLSELSELTLSPDAPKRRRMVRLRCKAAALLAGRASAAKRLLDCDPDADGIEGQLARLSVLDRGPLEGARGRAYERLADAKSPRVQQAALRLLASHPEVKNAHRMLADALSSKRPGTLATAAQVLAAHPERASRAPAGAGASPEPSIIEAFNDTLESKQFKGSVEVSAALMDAAGALQLLSSKPALERYCKSDQPALREHAQRALWKLGDKQAACDTFTPPKTAPPELKRALELDEPQQLVFKTDIGELELTLDPTWAPVAVARIVALVDSGHFENMPVHRVVPGFVVQFGDDSGDGFGHAGRPPIRCETAPVPFEAYEVGMALAGRDTASSQLFVTLERYPRLDGNYAWVGRASPGWERLAEGDRILSVSLRP